MNTGSEATRILSANQMIARTDESSMEHVRSDKFDDSQNPIDLLTQMLESIQLKSDILTPATFSAPWALDCERGTGRFYILTQGRCWLVMKELKCPVFLVRGDLVFITHGQEHSLHDSLCGIEPSGLMQDGLITETGHAGQSEPTTLVRGSFFCDSDEFAPLISAIPPLMHIGGEEQRNQPGFEDILRVIIHEAASDKTGSRTIVDRLVQILFIQAIRTCSDTILSKMRGENLPAGVMDPEIGLVIQCMNQKPELPWTVASLAEKACMSRSVFAARFTSLVGMPPLRYLQQCRMNKACRMLRETPRGIKKIANSIGYSSEAAFSNAFKRWFGTAPGQYRIADRPV